MNYRDPWSVLGINATRDQTEIRRAYARRLKLTNPEDDPEGFQELRAAYEHAQDMATYDYGYDEDDGEDVDEAPAFLDLAQPLGNRIAPTLAVVGAHPAGPASDAEAQVLASRDDISSPEGVAGAPAHEAPPPGALPWGQPVDEEARHRALCDALWTTVNNPNAEPAEVFVALKVVLTSPAMDSITTHEQTEQWLAGLAAGPAPQALLLVEPLINHFRWSQDRLGWRPEAAEAVFARRGEEALLDAVVRPNHPQYRAYRVLSHEPSPKAQWLQRFTPGLSREIRELLTLLRGDWPGVLSRLNPAAVGWWDAFLERPQFNPLLLIVLTGISALGVFAIGFSSGSPGFRLEHPWIVGLSGLAVPVVGTLGWLYGIERPRWFWANLDSYELSPWLKLGWAPAALVLVLIAGLAPAASWVTAGLGVAGAVVAYWAVITGEPDRGAGQGTIWQLSFYNLITLALFLTQFLWRPGQRYPWPLRAVSAFFYLAFFWWIASQFLDHAVWLQLAVALFAGAVAMVAGAQSLHEFWIWEMTARQRTVAIGGLGVATLAALALLAGEEPVKALIPPGLALAGAAVLIHKTPAMSFEGLSYLIRDLVMRFGWVVVPGAAAYVGIPIPLKLMAGWLLSGVLITVVATLVNEWRPRR